MSSLRNRLLLTMTLGMGIVLLLAGDALDRMIWASMIAEFDESLTNTAKTMAGLVEQEGNRLDLEFEELEMAEFQRNNRPSYYQIRLANGGAVARSPSLKSGDLTSPSPPAAASPIADTQLPDGRSGRMITLTFQARADHESPPQGEPAQLVLAVARDLHNSQTAMRRMRIALAIVGLVTTLITIIILACLVYVGLKPADALARRIGDIDERDLAARIETRNCPDELRPIAERLNALLERLAGAFDREKTMTANVAHELRTPLAGLRSTLEVTLTQSRDEATYTGAMRDCLEICKQSQSLLETLLTLARLDAGAESTYLERIDVAQLLHDAWTPFIASATIKSLNVTRHVEPDLAAISDISKLRLVCRNLFENAVYYADADGAVEISARTHDGNLQIVVSNSGSRVKAEDAHRVFARFWRGDAARSQDANHRGIGLSLCARVVEHLSGEISVESTNGGRFIVKMTIPNSNG